MHRYSRGYLTSRGAILRAMNKHTCIKPGCGASYEDDDVDAYYCPPCNEQRKIIAAEIDAKFPRTREPVISALKQFDSQPKAHGFVIAKL